jgi:hypothetical protein
MKLPLKVLLGLGLALALAHGADAARPTPVVLAEINYLLDYLGQSGCDFYRNGAWYDSGTAKAHLRYKYDWLTQHGEIATTEEFIDKAATKSSLSGRAYKVRCAGGLELSSSQWLLNALASYRLDRIRDSSRAPGTHGAPGAPPPPGETAMRPPH